MRITDATLGSSIGVRGFSQSPGLLDTNTQLHLLISHTAGHSKPTPEPPPPRAADSGRRCSLRRRARLPSLPASGLGKAGILPPPQLATRLRGPLPLVRSRFASLHPHRLLACGHSRFPSLGFELPAFTNRSALPPQGSGAALK